MKSASNKIKNYNTAGFSKVIILIIALVLIAGVVLIWQFWPKGVGTLDWRTFRSVQGGWEISFPLDYYMERELNEIGNGDVEVDSAHLSVLLGYTPIILSIEIESDTVKLSEVDFADYIREEIQRVRGDDMKILKLHEAKVINGHQMIRVELWEKTDGNYDAYVFKKNDTNIVSVMVIGRDMEEFVNRVLEIEAIISTFKFID